jgi:tetratricopeptide (TPR) repeat protein
VKRFGVEFKISRQMLLIGLMCERLRRYEEAEQILTAMKDYRNDLPHPHSFLGLCYISQGRPRDAVRELEAVLIAHPEHQMGKVLLGIAHRNDGRSGWQRLLHEVIADGRDEFAIKLARDTLGVDGGVPSMPGSGSHVVNRVYG